mgnify:CR=1 FL=1
MTKVGEILGLTANATDPMVAVVRCNGSHKNCQRTNTYDVAWSSDTGARTATLTSTYTNAVGDPAKLPPVVVGNQTGAPAGTQIREVSVLSPSRNVSLKVDGKRTPARLALEEGLYRHSVSLSIPPGKSVELRWRIEGTLLAGPYDLTLVRPAKGGTSDTNVVVRDVDRTVIDETVEPGRTVRLTG